MLKAAIIVFSFMIFVFVEEALASKILPPDRTFIAREATYVFVGKIMDVRDLSEPSQRCNSVNNVTKIEVIENIRGEASRIIELPVCAGNKAFNRVLEKQRLYIFFLKKVGDEYKRLYPIGGIIEFYSGMNFRPS